MPFIRILSVLLAAVVLAPSPAAQVNPDATLESALQSLAERASVVFVGEVLSVRPQRGAIEVTFRVDQALQGSPGPTYILREWPGLYAAGQQRFQPAQRGIFFLRAPVNAEGFGGLVDGLDGALSLRAQQGIDAVDLRRLQTRVVRPMGAALSAEASSAPLSQVAAAVHAGFLRAHPVLLPPLPTRLPVRVQTEAGDADR